MSDKDEAELWQQMDEAFQAAVEQAKNVGAHAHVGRAELEQHMREAHGIVAEARANLETGKDGTRVGEVIELDAIGEARLRASHWRAHEVGVGHRP